MVVFNHADPSSSSNVHDRDRGQQSFSSSSSASHDEQSVRDTNGQLKPFKDQDDEDSATHDTGPCDARHWEISDSEADDGRTPPRALRDSDFGAETSHLLGGDMASDGSERKVSGVEEVELNRTDTEAGSTGTEEYKLYKRRFLGLACLCLSNITVSWGWLTFAPVASLTVEWFGLASESPVNWISTVILLTYAVATPAVIYLLHHRPITHSLYLASALLLIGSWLRYAGTRTTSFPLLMFGQILLGFAQPFFLSSPPYYSSLFFSPRGRISATALASLCNPIGAALAQLINPLWCTKASDLPSTVLYISILTTISILPVFTMSATPPTPPSASAAQTALHGKLPFKESFSRLVRNPQYWILSIMFWTYLGLFNAMSTLLSQILTPAGLTLDQAGIAGAVLIVVGLICAAILSPIIDRRSDPNTKLLYFKLLVPVIALGYVAWVAVVEKRTLPGIMVIAAFIGGASFSLLPVALEISAEVTWPVGEEWGSCGLWVGGQVLGAVMIVVGDAMRGFGGSEGQGEGGMRYADVLMAAMAMLAAGGVVGLRRIVGRDKRALEGRGTPES